MKAAAVVFRLSFGTRKDDEAGVYVGYCPRLNLYSQGATEEQASEAIVDATQLFIITCYRRDTLHRVLREHGMCEAKPGVVPGEGHFIAVMEYEHLEEYDHKFERDVPIDLLVSAGMETAACQ